MSKTHGVVRGKRVVCFVIFALVPSLALSRRIPPEHDAAGNSPAGEDHDFQGDDLPYRADSVGRVADYAAAINERCGNGVTAENNAAIPFWQAVGPKDIPKEKREPFFRLLGIPPLPEEGHYLVQLYEYLEHVKDSPASGSPEWMKWSDDIYDQSKLAQSRPWSRKEYPVLADWLDCNEKPLEMILRSRRPVQVLGAARRQTGRFADRYGRDSKFFRFSLRRRTPPIAGHATGC